MEKCLLYDMRTYGYYQSPQSNETSQTYYLERTQSARIVLERAMKICSSVNENESSTSKTTIDSGVSSNLTETLNTSGGDLDNSNEKVCLVKKSSNRKESVTIII